MPVWSRNRRVKVRRLMQARAARSSSESDRAGSAMNSRQIAARRGSRGMGTLRLGAPGASMLSRISCTMRPSRPVRSYSRGSTIASRISARSRSDTSMTRHSRRVSLAAST